MCILSVVLLFFLFCHYHHFLVIANLLFFSGFAVLKIDIFGGSNYLCLSQLPLQCISSKMPAVMALPQIACSAKVLAQHIFPQFTFSGVSPSPWDTVHLHLCMSAKSCPSFALGILITGSLP